MGLGPYIRQGLMTYHQVLEIFPGKDKGDYFGSQDGSFAHFLKVGCTEIGPSGECDSPRISEASLMDDEDRYSFFEKIIK